MAKAIETCVHCGFCLPACPTYHVIGQEPDSPRGRIFLMKQVLEGELQQADIETHVDQCLGCLACETACPSGVKYRDLISPYRATKPSRKSFLERLLKSSGPDLIIHKGSIPSVESPPVHWY